MREWPLRLQLGMLIVLSVLALSVLSLFWTPQDPTTMNIPSRLEPPSLRHPLGTDQYGRDELSRVIKGSVNSVLVGFIAVGIGSVFGVLVGVMAAMGTTLLDEVLMRVMDALYSLPAVLLALLITSLLGPGIRNSMIAIGLFNIPIFARLTRGAILSIKSQEYVLAARALGVNSPRLVTIHMLPNTASPLLVQISNSFARALLAEAGLSYLGLGTQPPQPSWGRMLRSAQTFVARDPFLVIFPGLAIMIAVLGFNLFADGLRDLLDPRIESQY